MKTPTSLERFFTRTLKIEYSSYLFICVPILATCIRVLEEELLFGFTAAVDRLVLNYLAGYMLLHQMCAAALTLALKVEFRKAAGVASVGLVLAWLPPLIDYVLPAQPGRTYLYFREFNWDFAAPYQMLGETITLWLVVVATAVFTYWATRTWTRALLGILLIYIALQIFEWGWLALTKRILPAGSIGLYQLMTFVSIVLIMSIYSTCNYKSLGPSLRRFHHSLPWGLLSVIGSRMIGEPWSVSILKGCVMTLSFQLVIFCNDYFDREQDSRQGGTPRPVTYDDMVFMTWIMILLVAWLLVHNYKAFFLVFLFFTLWAGYHLPRLRFKRLFCLNYKIEGMSAAACFLFGILSFTAKDKGLASGGEGLSSFPRETWAPLLTLLVLGGFSLGSMFKDYKDIEQDRAEKIGTIYTRYLAMGKTLSDIQWFVAVATSLIFLMPPIAYLIFFHDIISAAILIGLALAVFLSLSFIREAALSVKTTLWVINMYLFIVAITMPVVR